MRVLCTNIINPATLETVTEHPSIRMGEEYNVLSIFVHADRGATFRVLTKDGRPALYDAAMFTTNDAQIPQNWVVRVRENGSIDFAPVAWLEPGFWERYFEDEPDAVQSFENESSQMLLRP